MNHEQTSHLLISQFLSHNNILTDKCSLQCAFNLTFLSGDLINEFLCYIFLSNNTTNNVLIHGSQIYLISPTWLGILSSFMDVIQYLLTLRVHSWRLLRSKHDTLNSSVIRECVFCWLDYLIIYTRVAATHTNLQLDSYRPNENLLNRKEAYLLSRPVKLEIHTIA
jgi:hypothetical protein